MAGPADGIHDAVRDLSNAAPIMQIGRAMDRIGTQIQSTADTASRKVRAGINQVKALTHATPARPVRRRTTDIALPASGRRLSRGGR